MKKGTIAILSAIGGAVLSVVSLRRNSNKKIAEITKMSEKHLALYQMMNQWVRVKQENKSIAEYLKKKGYKEIAIYGMNYVGETLLNELADSDIIVKYGIDKNAEQIYQDIDVLLPEDELSEVDAIIVTAITFFEEIKEKLNQKVACEVLSMENILYEI